MDFDRLSNRSILTVCHLINYFVRSRFSRIDCIFYYINFRCKIAVFFIFCSHIFQWIKLFSKLDRFIACADCRHMIDDRQRGNNLYVNLCFYSLVIHYIFRSINCLKRMCSEFFGYLRFIFPSKLFRQFKFT